MFVKKKNQWNLLILYCRNNALFKTYGNWNITQSIILSIVLALT